MTKDVDYEGGDLIDKFGKAESLLKKGLGDDSGSDSGSNKSGDSK